MNAGVAMNKDKLNKKELKKEKIKTGLVFIGGMAPSADICAALAKNADLIIAADSGLIAAENAGVRPDFIAGDMDSLDDESRLLKYPKERIFRFSAEKDLTDTELAVQILIEQGCSRIILAGGGGGRLSHIFAIKQLIEKEDFVTEWHTRDEKIYLLKHSSVLNLPVRKGGLVSVFPAGAPPFSASSKNLKWPLDGVKWDGAVTGISNIALADEISLRSNSGKFVIVVE